MRATNQKSHLEAEIYLSLGLNAGPGDTILARHSSSEFRDACMPEQAALIRNGYPSRLPWAAIPKFFSLLAT